MRVSSIKHCFCLFLAVLLNACTQNNPTGPAPQAWFYLDFTGYGEKIEPGYVKVYSDSSWEEYGGIDTVNGTAYLSILSSDSSLAFYTQSSGQYAGYKLLNQDPIIFDSPLPFLPTRWPSDTSFARTATFTLQGYFVKVTDLYTLVDTAGIATPVGNFSPSPHFEDDTYVSASDGESGYASRDIWTARGPGVIVTAQSGLSAVYLVRGYVNGINWGSPASARNFAARGGDSRELGLTEVLRRWKSGVRGAFAGGRSLFLPKR